MQGLRLPLDCTHSTGIWGRLFRFSPSGEGEEEGQLEPGTQGPGEQLASLLL